MKERESVIINIEEACRVEEGGRMDVLDELGNGENSMEVEEERKKKKEKRVWMSGKKPPRPPCTRLSLDAAADQKLIKDISEVLIMKRARIERIKALKPKPSSTSNFIAFFFTLLFCILIIFQGAIH